MNHCIFCGRYTEEKNNYHELCLKKIFGVNYLPGIELTLSEIYIEAQKMAGKLSISGVQPKLSMRLNRSCKKLEIAPEGGEYILKPQIDTFPNIPQNENLCMNMALSLKIDVPPHGLILLKDNSPAYIVKRFDRIKGKKIHQEDFSQILGEEDKYKGSLEKIGNRLWKISEVPGLDVQLFFERILFFFIIGNGDAHLKNFSILYDEEGHIRLSPAYDIVSSKMVIPDEEDLALSMNGRRNKITGKDFEQLAETLKINPKASCERILSKINIINDFIRKDLHLTNNEKEKFLSIVKERYDRVSGI
ncbi:MAG: HipA domain-containing protein [Armatimonadota bacterium]